MRTVSRQHRIYFDVSLCGHFDRLDKKFLEIWCDYTMYDPEDEEVARKRRKARWQAWDKVSKEVPPMLQEIEGQMQPVPRMVTSFKGHIDRLVLKMDRGVCGRARL